MNQRSEKLKSMEINGVFIDEYYMGKKLMDGVMDWFREKEIHRVKLHAYSWNQNARSIYEAQGFKDYVVSYERFL